jgi:hypothetical protein
MIAVVARAQATIVLQEGDSHLKREHIAGISKYVVANNTAPAPWFRARKCV